MYSAVRLGYSDLETVVYGLIQGDQKVSMHLMITIQSSGAQRLFDHPVFSLCNVSGWKVMCR